jgi:hypothetical protein
MNQNSDSELKWEGISVVLIVLAAIIESPTEDYYL